MVHLTPRGFKVYGEFFDARGRLLRVQESSADPLIHAHVFTDNDKPPYINVEQAKQLIAALQAFVADKEGR